MVPIAQEIISNGIELVNGSDIKMGCDNIVAIDGMAICGDPLGSSHSFLTDGNIPTINTSAPNWASELVTVKRTPINSEITVDHVLLTFRFNNHVHITAIYLDLLLCPEWNIGAPYITVFGSHTHTFSYNYGQQDANFLASFAPIQTTCNCKMSTVVIPIQSGERAYAVWYILVSPLPAKPLGWVHVGEVRFSDIPSVESEPVPEVFCTIQYLPGECFYE